MPKSRSLATPDFRWYVQGPERQVQTKNTLKSEANSDQVDIGQVQSNLIAIVPMPLGLIWTP